ncbi:MAG: ADP-ribosylglycohydrolase family protein [Burkholderia sp.]|nr:ADP-ribosylglycohydrolase family protein [Burkholderia sp.]
MENQYALLDRATGCLLAGAAGDALGAPVEFMDRPEILRRYGPEGLRSYVPAYGGIGKITDDTQMTLFTAEGCLRARHHALLQGADDGIEIIRRAYQRWLKTQTSGTPVETSRTDSWLLQQSALFARRAPGNTCLSALSRKGGERNHSKGCGGIMRVAPCGIVHVDQPLQAFNLGSASARLTHGHPTGYLAAGVFAAVIAGLVAGKSLEKAADTARQILVGFPDHGETLQAINMAVRMAAHGEAPDRAIPVLGEGWVAEEALGISLYCALIAESLEEGVIMAVNITGDSDSTGAITGNLLGALHGVSAIPARWLESLEIKNVIETVASDLVRVPHLTGGSCDTWPVRYPAS